MSENDFIRQPSAEEVRDFVNINVPIHKRNTIKNKYLKQLQDLRKEYQRKYEPYDYACAKIDFEEEYDKLMREQMSKNINVLDNEGIGGNIKFEFDFKKYGDKKRFKLLATNESFAKIPKMIAGELKSQVLSDYVERYICKDRGHAIIVFVPVDVYNARHKKKE